jgi:hypothetical protein
MTLMHFFLLMSILGQNLALPFWKMLAFVPPGNLRDFALFGVRPSNKHCPSARCAYAANAVGEDLDIFAIGAFSLNHIYSHRLKFVNIICSQS